MAGASQRQLKHVRALRGRPSMRSRPSVALDQATSAAAAPGHVMHGVVRTTIVLAWAAGRLGADGGAAGAAGLRPRPCVPGRLIQPAGAVEDGRGARLPKLPQQGGRADDLGAVDAIPHLPVRGDHDAEWHAIFLELLHLKHAVIGSEVLNSVMLALSRASLASCWCRSLRCYGCKSTSYRASALACGQPTVYKEESAQCGEN